MTAALGPVPPLPPEPPFPPTSPRSPWQPEPRPPMPGPASSAAAVVVNGDWLAERLLDRRVIALAGELDAEAVNRAVAALALLDAGGDDPIQLRLFGVSGNVDAVLALVDALDLVGVPVHATCLGTTSGPVVALVAVADHRTAGRHATFHLSQPRPSHGIAAEDVQTAASEWSRQLAALADRLAEACGRPVDGVVADLRSGRLLSAEEAKDYGLVDAVETGRRDTP